MLAGPDIPRELALGRQVATSLEPRREDANCAELTSCPCRLVWRRDIEYRLVRERDVLQKLPPEPTTPMRELSDRLSTPIFLPVANPWDRVGTILAAASGAVGYAAVELYFDAPPTL